MANNVIEILLRAKDQTQAVLGKFKTNLLSVKGLVATVFSAAVIGGSIRKFINETTESEKSLALLRNALGNVGKAAGVTEGDLLAQASALQRMTRFSDEAVQQTQALLLRIGLTGETLKRATADTADFAEAMQTDMVGAARMMGRALNDPVAGLTMLRRQGIAFTAEQQALIKALVESGEKAKAQAMVFDLLEKKFKGAAEAGGKTLGGAMARLRNAFGELFEASRKDSGKVVEGIEKITGALQAPETKKAIDTLAGWFSSLFSSIVTGAAAAVNAIASIAVGPNLDVQIAELQKKIAEARAGKQVGRAGRTDGDTETVARRNRAGVAVNAAAMEQDLARLIKQRERLSLQPVEIIGVGATRKLHEQVVTILDEIALVGKAAQGATQDDPIGEMFRDMSRSTQTETEKVVAQIDELLLKLKILQSDVTPKGERISKAVADTRRKEGLDALLPEFDLQKIRELRKPIQAELTEMSQFMIGVFRRMGESISQSLSDAFYNGKVDAQAFKDVVRRVLADIAATMLTSGIKKAFTGLLGGSSSSSGSGAGTIISGIVKAFGFAAGGSSKISKPTVVGEELVMPSDASRVFNQRQLAFMAGSGGGKDVVYSPTNNYYVQGGGNQDDLLLAMAGMVAKSEARQQKQLQKTMENNGFGRLR